MRQQVLRRPALSYPDGRALQRAEPHNEGELLLPRLSDQGQQPLFEIILADAVPVVLHHFLLQVTHTIAPGLTLHGRATLLFRPGGAMRRRAILPLGPGRIGRWRRWERSSHSLAAR